MLISDSCMQKIQQDDIFQSIVDICYNAWQNENDWTYTDMVNHARYVYGELAEFAVLVGKHYQQVCNGGHDQYIINNYCGNEFVNHKRLIVLMEKFNLHKHDIGSVVYKIMCNTPQINEDELYNHDIEHELNKLDNEFYSVDKEWFNFLNKFFSDMINKSKSNN